MSWRDRYQAQGKLDEAEFWVESDNATIGRRTQTHEYPGRDNPYVEDNGRRAREISFEAVCIGPDYDLARDTLIAVLERPGPYELLHPYFGALTVSVTAARKRESTKEGGKAVFSLTCIEAGKKTFPSATPDTAKDVGDAADNALARAQDAFSFRFDFTSLPGWQLVELVNEVAEIFEEVDAFIGDVAGAISAVIRAPYDLAGVIIDGLKGLRNTISEPLRALNLYRGLFEAGKNSSNPVPQTTSNRKRQAANTDARHALRQQGATIEAVRASSEAEYVSADDAMTMRSTLLDVVDAQMERDNIIINPAAGSASIEVVTNQPIDDALYQGLATLRHTMADDLKIRGARLPEIKYVEYVETLPALVIAHKLFGDATRDEEIIARNKIAHPLFCPAGRLLEVLSE